MKMIFIEPSDVRAAQALADQMIETGAEKHPILVDLRRDVWRGSGAVAMLDDKGWPLGLQVSHIGKRHSSIWEPVLNWHGVYVMPKARRQGIAEALFREVESRALREGCRRIKSLAGSSAGLAFHKYMGHDCWGPTPNGEVYVNSALPFEGAEELYRDQVPPQAPSAKMGDAEIDRYIKEGLRYDRK